ncbi:MAG: radical SAM protein [Candidatus Woesearchaeota archaeon]
MLDFVKKLPWLLVFGFKNLKIKLFSFFKKDFKDPYRILIKVNNSCNYRCKTCKIWKNKNNSFLSTKKQNKIITKYKNKLFFLSITGGEPFLDSKKLIKFIKNIKLNNSNLKYISINTNCSFPNRVEEVTEELLSNYPKMKIYLGLHYIPNKKWGIEKTGIKMAFDNYKKTIKRVKKIKKKYNNFSFYKMITISKFDDLKSIKEEDDLWINFATWNNFYNNINNDYIEKITNENKIKIINKFLDKNKKNISFLNKQYLYNLKKILSDERKRKCFAGISRNYINQKGETFICSRGLKSRNEMSKDKCANCWTACEANFDLVPYFFLPPFINLHKKDYQNN